MRSLLWVDWTTVRGSGTTPIVQASPDWLDLPSFADAVFWIEIAEVTNPGAGSVTLALETAPAPFESLFVPVDTFETVVASKTPKVRKVFLNGAGGVPLAQLLRWTLKGTVAGTWDVTFRLHVTLGEGLRNAFSPRSLPNLVLWLRADQGVTQSGGLVTQWNDLSGAGNHVSQSVSGSRPVLASAAIGRRPAIDFTGSKFMQNTATSLVTGGAAYSVLCVAKNGNGTFFSLRLASPPATTYSASMFAGATTYVYSDSGTSDERVPNTLAETQSATAAFKSCHRYNGAGSFANITLNGTARTPVLGFAQATETGATGFQVGTNTQTVPEFWNGQIAEIIVTSDAIKTADRLRVEAYQKDFFGV